MKKERAVTKKAMDALVSQLVTVRDLLRYAMSRFGAAEVFHGHGTTSAIDEAAFIILESLRLPVDDINPWLDARLLPEERRAIIALIEKRIATRKPAAYLLGHAYIQGVRLRADERALVPRSFIGEILFSENFAGDAPLLADPDQIDKRARSLHRLGIIGDPCSQVPFRKRRSMRSIFRMMLWHWRKLNVADHGLERSHPAFEGRSLRTRWQGALRPHHQQPALCRSRRHGGIAGRNIAMSRLWPWPAAMTGLRSSGGSCACGRASQSGRRASVRDRPLPPGLGGGLSGARFSVDRYGREFGRSLLADEGAAGVTIRLAIKSPRPLWERATRAFRPEAGEGYVSVDM